MGRDGRPNTRAILGAISGAVPSAPSPPLALLDALLRARREPSDALEAEVLAATLETVAAFTRCFHALDAHVKLSAVLSAPAAEDDGGAPSRSPMITPPPPPRLRSAMLYAMGILSDPSPALHASAHHSASSGILSDPSPALHASAHHSASSGIRYIPDPSLKRQIPRATGSPNLATWAFCPALLPNRSNAHRSSS